MKKFLLSAVFIAGFAAWTIHMHSASVVADTSAPGSLGSFSGQQATLTTISSSGTVAQVPVTTKKNPTPTPVPTPVPTPAPKPAPTGTFVDGTYTGSVADAYYGNVQVQALITNGALSDIRFLQYPSDRSTSRQIANYSLPRLRQEAIQSQSANVNTISGATDDSGAFRQSLSAALAQAKRI